MSERFPGHRFALAGLLLAGAALLASRLGTQSLWGDEAITLLPVTAARGLRDLVQRVRAIDTQPPASHLILYGARRLLPANEIGWRFPSLLEATIAAALLSALALRLAGPVAALVTGGCAIGSPFLAFYAMEARNYALWLLAVAAAAWAMDGWCRSLAASGGARRTRLWALAWGAANALGLWTHLFHFFSIAAQAAVAGGLFWVARPARPVLRRALWTGGAALGGALLSIAPWFLGLSHGAAMARGVGWTRPLDPAGFAYYPFAFLFGFSLGPDLRELHEQPAPALAAAHPLVLLSAAAAAALLITALVALVATPRQASSTARQAGLFRALFVLGPAAGFLGPLAFAMTRDFPLVPRHLIFLWPALPLLQGASWALRPRLRPALLALFLLQAAALGNLLFDPAYAKDDERAAVGHAEARSGAVAYVLGDAAPLYARRTRGLMKSLVNPRQEALFDPATTDLWLVENRRWEDREGQYRRKVEEAAARLGLAEAVAEGNFHGLQLWHWSRPERIR